MKIIAKPSESTVRRLLEEADLPTSDITPQMLETFFACESEGKVVGIVGLELKGSVGLLRSLVVSSHNRSKGLGATLLGHAEDVARDSGVGRLYLLTTTAEDYFKKWGYEAAQRETAPPQIRESSEFSEICPASSAFMVKRL